MSSQDSKRLKCAKYNMFGTNVKFHRFPKPGAPGKDHQFLKARVWAEYCFPNEDRTSEEYLRNLYNKHKMLCSDHFDISSYTSSDRTTLNNIAIPIGVKEILEKLRQNQTTRNFQPTSDMHIDEQEPGPSSHIIETQDHTMPKVLDACVEAGPHVIGTVCDCDGANIRALNLLGSSTENPTFIHKDHEIATVLDPPHLLKCFRNNFLKYDIEYNFDVQVENAPVKGVAKWSHIKDFFKKDSINPNFVFAPGLTQQHLQLNGKQKMKVRLAAQVLSHTVAAGMFAKISQSELPQEAVATADLLSRIDKLFDLMNGDTPDRKRRKPHLTNYTVSSPHEEY